MDGIRPLPPWDFSGTNAAMILRFSATVLAAVLLPWFARALLRSHPYRKEWLLP
jgi:hypothetical protein